MWSDLRNRLKFTLPAQNVLPAFAARIGGAVTQSVTWVAGTPGRVRLRRAVRSANLVQRRSQQVMNRLKPRNFLLAADAAPEQRRTQAQQFLVLASGAFLFSTLGTLGVPVFIWLGSGLLTVLAIPVCLRGLRDLSRLNINLNVLYLVATSGMLITGNFWAGSFGMFIYALAEQLTLHVTDASRKQADALFKVHQDFVYVIYDGARVLRSFSELQPGDIVAVHASDTIPVDGRVVAGIGTVDQSVMTGKAQLAEKVAGHAVFATTVLLTGWLHIEVEKAGEATAGVRGGQTWSRAADFMSTTRLRSQQLSDRSVLPTLILGAACLPVMGASGALAVISTHFKARMNVTAPLSVLNYFRQSSKQGILFKDGRSLDLLHGVDTIVFGNAGILTSEELAVQLVVVFVPAVTEQMVLQYAASAEAPQDDAPARAILRAAQQQALDLLPLDEVESAMRGGMQGVIRGQVVRVGPVQFMEAQQLPVPTAAVQCAQQSSVQGHTLILVAVGQVILGGIELVAPLRPEARQVVEQLRQLPQIQTIYVLSSDIEASACRLADELGIVHSAAAAGPLGRAEWVEQLQKEGRSICYIGNGINDSIALHQAKVSVALHRGSPWKMETAQIVLMDGRLTQLPTLFEIARKFRNNTNVMFGVTLAPMLVGIASIFLLQYGVVQIVIINKIGLAAATGIAMLPLRQPFLGRSQHTLLQEQHPEPSADSDCR